LGEQYLGLEAGGDEENLANGDKIQHTQDAVVLEKMISQFLYSKASETNTDSTSTKNEESTKTEDDALGASPLDNIGK
jgi:phospholipid/cholesterol/gamma-HCH transport system substrate-binding protein